MMSRVQLHTRVQKTDCTAAGGIKRVSPPLPSRKLVSIGVCAALSVRLKRWVGGLRGPPASDQDRSSLGAVLYMA